jgi:hypothetical protein
MVVFGGVIFVGFKVERFFSISQLLLLLFSIAQRAKQINRNME